MFVTLGRIQINRVAFRSITYLICIEHSCTKNISRAFYVRWLCFFHNTKGYSVPCSRGPYHETPKSKNSPSHTFATRTVKCSWACGKTGWRGDCLRWAQRWNTFDCLRWAQRWNTFDCLRWAQRWNTFDFSWRAISHGRCIRVSHLYCCWNWAWRRRLHACKSTGGAWHCRWRRLNRTAGIHKSHRCCVFMTIIASPTLYAITTISSIFENSS